MSHEQEKNRVFSAIRKYSPFQLVLNFLLCIPSDPRRMPFIESAPDGLRHIFTTNSTPEAELLRQVLIEAGFHVEYVPSTGTAIFGITGGSTAIHVPEAEAENAAAFLRDYLNPPKK